MRCWNVSVRERRCSVGVSSGCGRLEYWSGNSSDGGCCRAMSECEVTWSRAVGGGARTLFKEPTGFDVDLFLFQSRCEGSACFCGDEELDFLEGREEGDEDAIEFILLYIEFPKVESLWNGCLGGR